MTATEPRNSATCSGPCEEWESERPGPCSEPVNPSSKAWCTAHQEERRTYYGRRFRELGGLVSRLRRTKPRSAKGRRAWIRNQFAQLNQELRRGYKIPPEEDNENTRSKSF